MSIPGSFHQHYHFIKQLAVALDSWLLGSIIEDSFTISKQELVMLFRKNNEQLVLKVISKFHSGFLLFENTPYHKGSNAQACFESIINQQVISV